MKKIKATPLALLAALALSYSANAQTSTTYITKKSVLTENELKRWSHLDLVKDSIPGMSVDKAYAELIKDKKGATVIVGVVDSGVDIDHEDLKSVIWTNKKEIAGNGIDDDKNGYIDDIHGWNFLGNAEKEALEMTRILKKGDENSEAYKAAKIMYDEKYKEALGGKKQVDFIIATNESIQKHLNKENYTLEDLNAIVTTDAALNKSKMIMTQIIGQAGPNFNKEINEYKTHVYDQLNYNLNLEFDGRKVVGDNPEDINDKKYGNNVVYGPDKKGALHGTHVAGIIAQGRYNELGGDGISKNTQIMVVRAVPDGDEYDKDIALGIRYAVDNGAKVINASFGKSFSPHKQWVFDAIKYAESKDVLIIHAAGNDSEDIDVASNFPNDSNDNKTEFANNVITVGALNFENGAKLAAEFSNYGKFNVDVFAPGVKIYATTPNNEYQYLQGTSMASPNVAGVAAMIRSYYPKLSAAQVKKIIMESGTTISYDVVVGGNPEDVRNFEALSKTGKIVNAYNALQMAEQMSKKGNKKIKG